MGTVILQQLSGRFLAILDLLWHLPLFWDALSALPLMWPSLGDTLAMPDLDLLEFTVLVMLQLLLLEFMVLVMPQLLLLPQPLLQKQLSPSKCTLDRPAMCPDMPPGSTSQPPPIFPSLSQLSSGDPTLSTPPLSRPRLKSTMSRIPSSLSARLMPLMMLPSTPRRLSRSQPPSMSMPLTMSHTQSLSRERPSSRSPLPPLSRLTLTMSMPPPLLPDMLDMLVMSDTSVMLPPLLLPSTKDPLS